MAPPSAFDEDVPLQVLSDVLVRVNVPHNLRAVETLSAYPYPVQPPRQKGSIRPLPTRDQGLKGYLLQSGYANRRGWDRPYPPFGWRWEYAYNAALRRSGRSVPHTMMAMYPWCNDMVKFVKPEVERANDAEKERQLRYSRAVEQYQKSYADLESEATRRGLYPCELRMSRAGQAQTRLAPGTWWIVGTHKVPGLTYYWQTPVTVTKGDTAQVLLTEANALVLEGGW